MLQGTSLNMLKFYQISWWIVKVQRKVSGARPDDSGRAQFVPWRGCIERVGNSGKLSEGLLAGIPANAKHSTPGHSKNTFCKPSALFFSPSSTFLFFPVHLLRLVLKVFPGAFLWLELPLTTPWSKYTLKWGVCAMLYMCLQKQLWPSILPKPLQVPSYMYVVHVIWQIHLPHHRDVVIV